MREPLLRTRGSLVFALVATTLAGGAGAADVEALLAAPPDAAHLVALVPYRVDPRVEPRLVAALAAPDPATRQVAARALHATGARGAAAPLGDALQTETDPATALELVDALGALGDPAPGPLLLAAAVRLGGSLPDEVALRVARQGAAGLPALTTLRPRLTPTGLHWAYRALLKADASLLPTVARQVVEIPQAWTAVLSAADQMELPLDPVLLARAIYAEATRDETLWFVIRTEGATPEVVIAAAESAAATSGRSVAMEIALRKAGRPPRQDLGRDVRGDLVRHQWDALPYLTPDERHALSRTLYGDDRYYDAGPKGLRSRPPTLTDPLPTLRAVTGLPPGVVAGVLRLTGCQGGDAQAIAQATVRFAPEGWPVAIESETGASSSCREALRALAGVMLDDGTTAPGLATAVFLPLDPDVAECTSPQTRGPVSVGGKVAEPRKVANAAPRYPEGAKALRLGGIVVMEATISPAGCVQRAQVVRSAHPLLDVEAVQAVVRWRYAPTLLEGVPVPVMMTVTVSFAMH